jgi:phospho-N-acetylmuramoyl-pentapeptide-transferase
MVYAWLYPLHDIIHAFNVFRYVTFRAVYAAIFALAISFLLGKWTIAKLKEMKVGQPVRQDGPQTHLKKQGTPTMGGVLILFAVIASSLIWARWDNRYLWMLLATAAWFGGLGAWDDFAKLKARKSDGLSAKSKLALQLLGAGLVMAIYIRTNPAGFAHASELNLPFIRQPLPLPAWFHVALSMLVIAGMSNAVNLTDGLDGLAAGTSALVALVMVVAAYLAGNYKLAEYLRIPFLPGMGEGAVVMAGVFGACLGFLWFNAYPAAVFMGDTGSLALGALFGAVAVLAEQEHLLAIVGGIFVIEMLSVMIQVASFKLRGKRVFKMAPLHHHFQLHGWDEPKVIVRFWIVAIVLVLLSLSTLKLR